MNLCYFDHCDYREKLLSGNYRCRYGKCLKMDIYKHKQAQKVKALKESKIRLGGGDG